MCTSRATLLSELPFRKLPYTIPSPGTKPRTDLQWTMKRTQIFDTWYHNNHSCIPWVRALQQFLEEVEVLSEIIRKFFRAVVKEKLLLEEALVLSRPLKVDSFGSRCLFSGCYRTFSVQFLSQFEHPKWVHITKRVIYKIVRFYKDYSQKLWETDIFGQTAVPGEGIANLKHSRSY
jgi:hypothetical protein